MTRQRLDLKGQLPISREKAALVASTASHFPCTVTLERDDIVLNLKSMIGLLSQSIPRDGLIDLVASGQDEQEAVMAIARVFQSSANG